jgi:hypothetical protein
MSQRHLYLESFNYCWHFLLRPEQLVHLFTGSMRNFLPVMILSPENSCQWNAWFLHCAKKYRWRWLKHTNIWDVELPSTMDYVLLYAHGLKFTKVDNLIFDHSGASKDGDQFEAMLAICSLCWKTLQSNGIASKDFTLAGTSLTGVLEAWRMHRN